MLAGVVVGEVGAAYVDVDLVLLVRFMLVVSFPLEKKVVGCVREVSEQSVPDTG